MEFYKIGTMIIESPWMPSAYEAFRISDDEAAREPADFQMKIRESSIPFEKTEQTPVFEHAGMTIQKSGDSWILENQEQCGSLLVSADYGNVQMWKKPFTEKEKNLEPLLQMAVECGMIWNGIGILHAACVEKDGKAVAFSGPSGAGKSTKASRWEEELQAFWISGDRPAVDPARQMVYGVPWDGKEQIFVKRACPLLGILDVRKAFQTRIRRLTRKQAYDLLVHQMMIPMWDTALAGRAFAVLKQTVETIPVYRLYADKTNKAAHETYELLFQGGVISEEKESTDMRLKSGFEITEIAGEYMAIPTGENVAAYGGAVVLNEISAFLLNHLKEPSQKEDLLEILLETYEVDREKAEKDLDAVLRKFLELGLVETCGQ